MTIDKGKMLFEEHQNEKNNEEKNANDDVLIVSQTEEVNEIEFIKEEQCDMENTAIEVLERFLGETHETRMHAEKARKDKNYKSHSTKVHVKELEEITIEEDMFNNEDSSGLSNSD